MKIFSILLFLLIPIIGFTQEKYEWETTHDEYRIRDSITLSINPTEKFVKILTSYKVTYYHIFEINENTIILGDKTRLEFYSDKIIFIDESVISNIKCDNCTIDLFYTRDNF